MERSRRLGWGAVGRRAAWAAVPLALLAALNAAAEVGAVRAGTPAGAIDFNRDIRPILSTNCYACHGQDSGSRQAKLRLDTREGATAPRSGMRAVEPGKPEQSSLVARINATNALVMPPEASGHRLTAEQKRLLAEWVRQGAPYAEHWSFAPLRRPELPRVRNAAWVKSPIDAFVLARLEKEGLAPAPAADRYTLIRRVALDLTGLPPEPELVNAFLDDNSPDAYEKAVDRLLASPRFGEHWARMWLDLARYADSQGYEKDLPRTIWRYRDWVIDAYNRDLPYDRFTIEQLAGDLLPNPTPDQLLATAFHRNTMTNTEGGTDPEEFRVAAVKDRVDTTAQVWMGLTVGCAKCHTHKYDPITIEDYYRFYALFDQTEDANRFDEAPTVPTPTEAQRRRSAALDERLKGLREAFWQPVPGLESRQREWEAKLAAERLWTPLRFESARAESGAELKHRDDGAVLVSGAKAEKDTYTLTLPLPEGRAGALRLEALKDPSLPNGGPGRDAADQNVVTSELTVELLAPDGTRTPVALTGARADFQQGGWPVAAAVDGKPDSGWAWAPQNGQPHVAVFDFKTPVTAPGGKLVVKIEQHFARLQHGCFRLSVSGAEAKLLKAELTPLSDLAAASRERRSDADRRRLEEAFRQVHEPTSLVYKDLQAAEGERAALDREIPRTPVMRDLPPDRARVTKIHQRGNFLDPGEKVAPAVLASFHPLPSGAPANRLGAAQWLVSPENPLTPRVAVNRVWARIFGTGLVETEEDFGSQGTLPTHPELLDYLASLFAAPATSADPDRETERRSDGENRDRKAGSGPREAGVRTPSVPLSLRPSVSPSRGPKGLGWSHKQLCKTIVMSATYRQAARVSPEKATRDPNNQLFSRGPRFRLPAEVIRDQALASSGLLSDKMHGPSVMPPQPDGLWKTVYSGLTWKTSEGEDRYRRGLYTFWRRSTPYPSLTTFDAGSGEFCVVRRVRTNTPLQALVTLNDPAFVEAAGALGRRMVEAPGADVRARLAYGVRWVLVRPAAGTELARLERLHAATLADYREKPEAATALLKAAGQSPKAGQDAADLAAYVVVANVLLNLDEALTKP
ncbi:MAG: DUF1549 domain-containing protein [Armatimonadota bacterium]